MLFREMLKVYFCQLKLKLILADGTFYADRNVYFDHFYSCYFT